MPGVLLGILLLWAGAAAIHAAPLRAQSVMPAVAAASDLQFALEEVARRFHADTGHSVKLSWGSSGNFYQQIARGAPFEIFMSADEDFVFRLAASGHAVDRGTLYAVGRLALIVPRGSTVTVDARLAGLRGALREGHIRRFAIANPEHAPYGRAAEQALRKAGLWDAIRPHLVLGENVSQAAQFAVSGSAQGGIIAYSLALAPAVAKLGRHILLPEDLHAPLRQRMVLVKGAGTTAQRFYDYMQQPPARAILKRHGFVLPAAQ